MEMDISALRRVDESLVEKNASRPHGSIGAIVFGGLWVLLGVVMIVWLSTVGKTQGRIGCFESQEW